MLLFQRLKDIVLTTIFNWVQSIFSPGEFWDKINSLFVGQQPVVTEKDEVHIL